MTTKILQWNIRGFKPRRPALQSAIDSISPTVIAIQETHTNPQHQISLPSYHFPPARYDRQPRPGGGAAVFTHKSIPHLPITLNSTLEASASRIFFPERSFTICSLYLPPSTEHAFLADGLSHLIKQLPPPFLICTDANAHHPDWGSPTSDLRGRLISDWINDQSLILLNTGNPLLPILTRKPQPHRPQYLHAGASLSPTMENPPRPIRQ